MRTRLLLALVALSLACLSRAAFAQHDHDHAGGAHDHPHEAPQTPAPQAPGMERPTVEAPDTPAGKALAWLLASIDSNEDAQVEGRFTDEFFKQVPADTLRKTFGQMRAGLGGFLLRDVTAKSPTALIAVAQARTPGTMWNISLSVEEAEPHRIDGLLFRPAPAEAIAPLKDWADADAILNTLGTARSLAVYEVALDGARTPVHLLNENEALPLGSAFKMYVLGALAEAIEAGGPGAPTWDEVLEIDDDWKSLPGGVMQNLPRGSEAPILEFATKMISISDNTATDHLIKRVGRGRVEKYYTARVSAGAAGKTLPFLTTREMFNVKISMDPERLGRYAQADEVTRRAMLAGPDAGGAKPGHVEGDAKDGAADAGAPADRGISAETPSMMNAQQWRVPQGVDSVEWFASTAEACAAMVDMWRMSHRPALMQVADVCSKNRGLPLDNEDWPYVMFKGGSEPGVLNVTWLLERAHDGKRDVPVKYVVSLSVMDTAKAIDEDKAIGVAQRVIELLGTR